ncbi:FadR/GntR family transcriptional regulator [Rhizosaccharibacter radicis]|uniref:FadR family transcriptional regulator n=1 Tax=Rhizosaccharibacter radicis TaxID=2782605 RepID=A0ABT1W0A8_9PROT|nr:FadR family transcriptional regulator [Acetobacteraceae bacterium KSS12]
MSPRPRRPAIELGRPVKRRRAAHDLALHRIGSAIVRGDYPVGSLLPPKEELMRALDLSHTTIREALQTLAAKGMIAARARIGTRVLEEAHWNMFDADLLGWRMEVGLSRSLLGMLLEIRQSIEPLAAALAATHRTGADVIRLRELVAMMHDDPKREHGFVDADVEFHKLILGMSGNSFMASLAAVTGTALTASLAMSAPDHDPPLEHLVLQQHAAIVDAIEARDPQAASDAMIAVIRQGWTNLQGLYPRPIARIELLTFPPDEEG